MNEQNKEFRNNLDPETQDVDALIDFVDIKIDLEVAKGNLELANQDISSENVNCETIELLSEFVEGVRTVVMDIDSFIEHYPELVDKTKLSQEMSEDLNSNAEEIELVIDTFNTQLECN